MAKRVTKVTLGRRENLDENLGGLFGTFFVHLHD